MDSLRLALTSVSHLGTFWRACLKMKIKHYLKKKKKKKQYECNRPNMVRQQPYGFYMQQNPLVYNICNDRFVLSEQFCMSIDPFVCSIYRIIRIIHCRFIRFLLKLIGNTDDGWFALIFRSRLRPRWSQVSALPV